MTTREERLRRPVEQAEKEEEEQAEEQEEQRGPFVPVGKALSKAEIAARTRQHNAAMLDALRALQPMADYPFADTLLVAASQASVVEDVEDDHERELVFTKQALEAAIDACDRLGALGVPYRRPDDYYAEMVKSDAHMGKIQERLGEERRRAEASEQARRERDMRKFAKQAKRERAKTHKEEKTQAASAVRDWRKKHSDAADAAMLPDGDDVNDDDDAAASGAPRRKKARQEREKEEEDSGAGHVRRKSAKRQAKDERYGGKKKRGWKRNNGHDDTGGWRKHTKDARAKALAASIPAEASALRHGDGGRHSKPPTKHRKATFRHRK